MSFQLKIKEALHVHWLGKTLIKQATESANLSTLALTVEIKELKERFKHGLPFFPHEIMILF